MSSENKANGNRHIRYRWIYSESYGEWLDIWLPVSWDPEQVRQFMRSVEQTDGDRQGCRWSGFEYEEVPHGATPVNAGDPVVRSTFPIAITKIGVYLYLRHTTYSLCWGLRFRWLPKRDPGITDVDWVWLWLGFAIEKFAIQED